MRKLLFIILIFLLTASVLFAQQTPQKYALVIGNKDYTNFGSLRNPINDANAVAEALKGLGFNVDIVRNGSLNDMENAAIRLKNRLTEAGNNTYGFFYYAGHGVQMDGLNYLIPTNANIPDRSFLRERAFSVQIMLDMLNDSKNALNMIVLDACRDFPATWSRNLNRGLSVIANPPANHIIMYATSAGKEAADGTGSNGLFTSHLLEHLKTPGIDVNEVFRRTMSAVARESKNEQRPALYTDFADVAYLGSRPSPNTPTPTTVPAGMVRINGGTFTMGGNGYLQRQVTVSSFYMGKYEVTQKEYQEIMGTNPSYFKGDNLPVETVSWYEAIEYCNKRSQKEGLTPAYIIDKNNKDKNNTSEYDTLKWIVTWNKSANGYRLPTEAEWEYACRAGTTTAYNTGATISDSTGWYYENSNERTQPVGQKPANAWGLHDTHGNVWEWCWDWYEAYASGAQTNPIGAVSGTDRVLRGGSWNNSTEYLVSANRDGDYPDGRFSSLGFRVARP